MFRLPVSKQETPTRSAMFLLALLTTGCICITIALLWASQRSLFEAEQERVLGDASREAKAMAQFFQERKYDLAATSQSPSFSIYFQNKSLGMSLKYGLALNINSIKDSLTNFVNTRTINNSQLYSCATFVDTQGTPLTHAVSDTMPSAEPECFKSSLMLLNAGSPQFIITNSSHPTIVLTAPLLHNGVVQGQVAGQINTEAIVTYHRLTTERTPHNIYLVGPDNFALSIGNSPLPTKDIKQFQNLPVNKLARIYTTGSLSHMQDARSSKLYSRVMHLSDNIFATRIPIRGTPLELVTLVTAKELGQRGMGMASLLAMSILTILSLIATTVSVIVGLKSTALSARVGEMQKRRKQVTSQNILLHKEIAERRKAEQEAIAARREAEQVNRVVPSAVITVNRAGYITGWNNRACELTGYTAEEAFGKYCVDLLQLQSETDHINNFEPCRGVRCTLTMRQKRQRTVLMNLEPLFDQEGVPYGIIKSFEDITLHQKTIAALATAEEKYRTVIEQAPYGIYQSTPAGKLETINPALASMFKYDSIQEMKDALEGKLDTLYAEPGRRTHFIRTLMQEKRVDSYESQYVTKTGEIIWVSESSRLVETHDGHVYFEGFAENITERKRAQYALIEAKDRAEEASRAKTTFLATISHEMRTPMNAIIGMAELLLRTELSPMHRRNLNIMRESATSLLTLLNDLLDLSRFESGKMKLAEEVLHLPKLLQDVHALMLTQARSKGLRFPPPLTEHLPTYVVGDTMRLRQILVNIMGNAVKFTKRGSVELLAAVKQQDDAPILLLTVRDTGIGIPRQKQQAIFESFTQADGSYSRKYGGSGLGLAICKEIIEAMGGTITLDSNVGIGTTVRVNVPTSITQKAIPSLKPVPEHTAMEKLRILIVEDNPFNQEVALQMAEIDQHDCMVAENGRTALDMLEQDSTIDLILMDIQMPEMDGIEATRSIRSGERTIRPDIPIIALSAHIMPEDRKKFLEAGMDAYLAKPVQLEELRTVIHQVMSRQSHISPPATDINQALDMLGGKKHVLTTVLTAYVSLVPETLKEFTIAVEKNDTEAAIRLAHSLKSTLRTVAANDAAQLFSELEKTAQQHNLDPLREQLDNARAMVQQTIQEVDDYLQKQHAASPSDEAETSEAPSPSHTANSTGTSNTA